MDVAGTSMVIGASILGQNAGRPSRTVDQRQNAGSIPHCALHCGGSRHGHTTNQWSQLETAPLVNRCGASFDKIIFIGERYAISRGVS